MSPVVVHGDFHLGNIMWKLDEDGEITNEVAVVFDWQMCHEGSPMADFIRLMVFCSNGGTRRQVEEFIFDFYHDELEKEMKEAGKSCPYTVDQIRKAYNYMYLSQCYGSVIMPKFMTEIFGHECPRVIEAKIDEAITICKHALEDMDRLLSGEMKDLYEKFGQ